jgi:serine/threonine protein kinase
VTDIYSGGDQDGIGIHPVNEVYLIYSPLAIHTFEALTRSERPEETRLILFQQCLRGLAHLHEHDIMHRDIKTTNLAVVSYAPLRAMIMDFGAATSDLSSTNHYRGTIPFLAPEIMALKNRDLDAPPYTRSVDIWSLGVVGYILFTTTAAAATASSPGSIRKSRPWYQEETPITPVLHASILAKLSPPPTPGTISNLLSRMLAWLSDHRPTAAVALADSVWPDDGVYSEDAATPPPLTGDPILSDAATKRRRT